MVSFRTNESAAESQLSSTAPDWTEVSPFHNPLHTLKHFTTNLDNTELDLIQLLITDNNKLAYHMHGGSKMGLDSNHSNAYQ